MTKEITIGDLMRMVADGDANASDVIKIYAKQPKAAKYEVWRGFKRVAFVGHGQIILEHHNEYETRLQSKDICKNWSQNTQDQSLVLQCDCQDPRTVWNGTLKQWICDDCKKPVNKGENNGTL